MSVKTKTSEAKVIIIPVDDATNGNEKRWPPKRPRPITVLFSLLAFIALVHLIAVARPSNPVPAITTCDQLIHDTDYTQAVHLQPNTQEMPAVQFVNQLVGGQPAALVQVVHTDAQNTLDVIIYGCKMQQHSPKLISLFTQRGLPQGAVSISSSNTLVLGALDTGMSPQAAALAQPLQQNIYREFSWSNGTFTQVTFPSLYPVASRTEAEALQQQANNGTAQLWSDPLKTAEQMARDLFKWTDISTQDTVSSNDGKTAQVQLFQQNPAMQVTVTLKRLVQQNSTGLWFVTGAATTGLVLTEPQAGTTFSSPASIKGTGALADGQATATLFDHTLTPFSLLNNPTLNVDSGGAFSGTLFYNNGAPNQQGVLLIQSQPPSGSTENGQLLLTGVIIG